MQSLIMVLGLLIFLNINTLNTHAQTKTGQTKYTLKKVCLDAGHGGKDPGAITSRVYEKHITLGITLKLGALIRKNCPDVEVVYTRNDDTFVELYRRGAIANEANADLFISIHANAGKPAYYYGTETYCMGLHKTAHNMDVAKSENAVISLEKDFTSHYEGFNNSPESYIVFSLLQNEYMEQSIHFATKVQENLVKYAKRKNDGVKQAGFLVLWTTAMPSVLIETGYITNPDEESFLSSQQGQEKMAFGIFNAFLEYKTWVESKGGKISVNQNPKQNLQTHTNANKQIQQNTTVNTITNNQTQKNIISPNLKKIDNNQKNKTIDPIKTSTIRFEVQITASKTQIPKNSSAFKGYKNVKETFQNGMYKYSIGETNSFATIEKTQKEVAAKFPGAFIIAFNGNERIPIIEAKKMAEK